jgi:hypothetical protein
MRENKKERDNDSAWPSPDKNPLLPSPVQDNKNLNLKKNAQK